jgi:maleate cis-trans isomerase
LARAIDTSQSQAIFIISTDFPTITVSKELEEEFGKPVVSTNQALLWNAL